MTQAGTTEPHIARRTVDQVDAMLEAGILEEGAPIELDGILMYKDRNGHGEDPMAVGKKHNLASSS